jgi:hypothetical protein
MRTWAAKSLAVCVGALGIGFASARPTNGNEHALLAPREKRANVDNAQSVRSRTTSIPFYFERNDGQSDSSVRFLSHRERSSLFLTDDAAVISLVGGGVRRRSARSESPTSVSPESQRLVENAISIHLLGANRHPQMSGLNPLKARVNYLVGDNPEKWHVGIPTFSMVKIGSVYSGIDLVYYGNSDKLEYDFTVAPGADPSKIKLSIEGARATILDAEGNLKISTDAGVVTMCKPRIYQPAANGSQTPIAGSFRIARRTSSHQEIRFQLASYLHSRPLVIDPAIAQVAYSSFLGGHASSVGPLALAQFSALTNNTPLSVADVGTDVAVDSSDNVYVTGIAYSNDFPRQSALQPSQNGANSPPLQNPNGFISKFDTSQSGPASLIYSTYIGGSGDTVIADRGHGNGDLPFGIASDSSGQPFIVGQTYSTDFPGRQSCGSFGETFDGANTFTNNGFISKLNATGSAIVYSCYINGSNNATEARVALFPLGCGGTSCKAYIVGSTQSDHSSGFPTTAGAFQSTLLGSNGKSNATFVVVHEDGQSLDYATLYGGSGNGANADTGLAVAADSNGNGYLTGATFSGDLVTKNPAFINYLGGANQTSNAFVAQFDPTLSGTSSLIYATYLGGTGAVGGIGSPINFTLALGDAGTGIAIDGSSNIWVTGFTASTDFHNIPGTETPVFQSTNQAAASAGAPATAAFVTEISSSHGTASANQILYASYFGGTGIQFSAFPLSGTIAFGDVATGIHVVDGKVYLTGATASGDLIDGIQGFFPLSPNACYVTNKTSGVPIIKNPKVSLPVTAWVAELDTTQSSSSGQLAFSTLLGGTGIADAGTGVGLLSNGNIVVGGLTYSSDFPITPNALQFSNGASAVSATNAFLTVLNPLGSTCPTPFATSTPTVSATPTATGTPGATHSATPTATTTPVVTATRTATPTVAATTTATPSPTATPTPSGAATTILSAAPTTLNFGNVDATGPSKAAKKLTVTNKGSVAALIGQATASAPFAVSASGDTCSKTTLEPKKHCSLAIVFSPPVVAPRLTGTISVPYNGGGPAVTLEGSAIAVVLKAPRSLTFAPTAAGTSSKGKSVVISNPDTVPVTLGTAQLTGAYSIGGDTCSGLALAPKGKCAIAVEFSSPGGAASGTVEPGSLTIKFIYGVNNGNVEVPISGKVK